VAAAQLDAATASTAQHTTIQSAQETVPSSHDIVIITHPFHYRYVFEVERNDCFSLSRVRLGLQLHFIIRKGCPLMSPSV